MATETDRQTALDQIKALVQKLVDALAAPPGVMTQAQLDSLVAEAQAILGTTPTPPSS